MADSPFDPDSQNDAEVELDIRAFLPEDADLDDDWGEGTPEPEVPAWARVDEPRSEPPLATATGPAPESDETDIDTSSTDTGPTDTGATDDAEEIDVRVLEGIEADLIEVDDAISALDAGEPSRSALLQRLLGGS